MNFKNLLLLIFEKFNFKNPVFSRLKWVDDLFFKFSGGDSDSYCVYSAFERLWNLARETFAPVWSLSKLFLSKNLVIKSLQKDLIWKYPKTATPWVFDWTWWNLASQVRPNAPSTNLSSMPPAFVWIVKFIFSLCMKMERVWKKVIWTITAWKPDFQKKISKKNFKENHFSNSWLSLISKSISTDIACRVEFGRFSYSIIFSFWLIGYSLFARSGPEKLTAGKIQA